ncbi:MAG: N-acetylmuramoyl-L-alanine amidase, partial [Bacilli bacterium]|nr:N-acetylmuramoyl-L-alanine amidase [Bacilli bacterium]
MNDLKVVIDAGHGGEDLGSSGNGIIEKDLTLAISEYMYDLLKDKGVNVKMTRTTDETVSPTERVNRILGAFGNNKDVIVVSNHINAGGGDGAEVVYALRNNNELANLILDELEKSGQNIRKAYQRRLPSDTSKDYYFIHRDTGVTEPVLIEYGFLDSTGDDVNQLKNDYKKYAEAVVNAILEYKNIAVPGTSDYY